MEMNQAGMDIIVFSEVGDDPVTKGKAGWILVDGRDCYLPKRDCLGIPTIGIGTISYPDGKIVTLNDPMITGEQALEYLNFELKDKASKIESWANQNQVRLSGNQFSALLCFGYNLGCGPIVNSDSSLNKALLSGEQLAIRSAFGLYVKGTKKRFGIPFKVTLPGLVIRRKKEADLFFS